MERLDPSLTVSEVGARAKSKVEVYRILATEDRVYLPDVKNINYYYFLRSIITGGKKASGRSVLL